jgi:hypothetical protein
LAVWYEHSRFQVESAECGYAIKACKVKNRVLFSDCFSSKSRKE